MFIGKNPTFKYDEDYDIKIVTFDNIYGEFYTKNIYKRVWSFRSLCKWRRLICNNITCIRILMFSHERV